MKWQMIVVLVCIPIITNSIEHILNLHIDYLLIFEFSNYLMIILMSMYFARFEVWFIFILS